MPARAAKFVSAIFAGVLAGIPLATISHGATPAKDDCLSGPKDQAAQGGHWYYRIDHATNRHCWYLRDAKLSRSDAANAAPAAKPASSNAETATQRSIADAHAELPAQTAVEQPKRGDGLAPAIAADASIATPAPATHPSVVASRWPEQSATDAPPDSDAMPSPAPAAATLAAGESSPEKQPDSIQTPLFVILGALALAGLIGSAVFKFGNLRWTARRRIQPDRRRAIWEPVHIDHRSPPVDPEPGARIRRNDIPWELRTADDPNGRIEEMLARLARSASN
jgi:hypothetical protein